MADVVLHLAQTEDAVVWLATGGDTFDRPRLQAPGVDDAAERMVQAERAEPAVVFERWKGAFRPSGGTGTDKSSVRLSGTTTAGPNRGGSPSPSIPATVPARSVPPGTTTTTTTDPEAPPADDSELGCRGARRAAGACARRSGRRLTIRSGVDLSSVHMFV